MATKTATVATVNLASILSNSEMWKRAGIEMPTGTDAAMRARENLKNAGANYVPNSATADNLMIMADMARAGIDAEAQGKRQACILLAAIDASGEYTRALTANGKPYTSTLALARDLFPQLQKSTVANYIGTGRNVYLPALQGSYGKASAGIAEQTPTVGLVIKGVLSDPKTRDTAVRAIGNALKHNTRLSAAEAKQLVTEVKEATGTETKKETARGAVKQTAKQPGGNSDDYNIILSKVKACIATSSTNDTVILTMSVGQRDSLRRMLQEAIVSREPKDAGLMCRALINVISG